MNKEAIIRGFNKQAKLYKEAYGYDFYDEKKNQHHLYERSPLDNLNPDGNKMSLPILHYIQQELKKNPKIQYTLSSERAGDNVPEYSIDQLLKKHKNNPVELDNYLFEHTVNPGKKYIKGYNYDGLPAAPKEEKPWWKI